MKIKRLADMLEEALDKTKPNFVPFLGSIKGKLVRDYPFNMDDFARNLLKIIKRNENQ